MERTQMPKILQPLPEEERQRLAKEVDERFAAAINQGRRNREAVKRVTQNVRVTPHLRYR